MGVVLGHLWIQQHCNTASSRIVEVDYACRCWDLNFLNLRYFIVFIHCNAN